MCDKYKGDFHSDAAYGQIITQAKAAATDPGLATKLMNTYKTILGTNSNIKLVVINYPYLVKNVHQRIAGADLWGWQDDLYAIQSDLNNSISHAISLTKSAYPQYADRIFFVSATAPGCPFDGHDLGANVSYFNNIVLPPKIDASLHPKQTGANAYASVVESFIKANAAALVK